MKKQLRKLPGFVRFNLRIHMIMMQKSELEKLEIAELKTLYLSESERLNRALLDGIEWEHLADQRKYLITIGVVLDSKNDYLKNLLIAAELQVNILK